MNEPRGQELIEPYRENYIIASCFLEIDLAGILNRTTFEKNVE
jgi:hypothetical protein